MLEVENLKAGYSGREIVHGISFAVQDGEFACILGANGCGKSTTLKTVLGLLPALGGSVLMDGHETGGMGERERARLMGYIPQSHTPPFPFTVRDVVLMGRTPYLNFGRVMGREDERIARECMARLSIEGLADVPYTELSGGQQQLALIARALVQQPRLLVMDEPTASLDFGNQQIALRQMRYLTRDGMAVLMVTHDPGHALLCADHVLIMEEGRVVGDGAPDEVVDTESLQRVYDADVEVANVEVRGQMRRVCMQVL